MTKAPPIQIAESIRDLAVPIGDVKPHPRNARQGDVGAISESLARFGQQKPIVVQRRTKRIVAGNHTWQAAKALGWEQIAVVYADLSDRQAVAFMVADNRTQELGAYNNDALISLLTEIASAGELTGTGWDGDDVDELLRRTGSMAGDPGAGILAGFDPSMAGRSASDGPVGDVKNGRDEAGTDYYALNLALTADQREVVFDAFRAAKEHGHETQPLAIVAIARAYLEANG